VSRRFRPLSSHRLDDLPPRCAGCVYWESRDPLPVRCGAACDREQLAGWIDYVGAQWGECGRIAYEDGEVLGFVKYAPPGFFEQTANLPSGRPSNDAVLLACLHVGPDARHVGLGTTLLHAALRDLAQRGERYVEAYAVHKPVDVKESPMVTADFLLRQGFTVRHPHPQYPLLRLEVKSLAAWTADLDAVLESLRLPLRSPSRAPASWGTG
jgi:ribosomal protein S18 acetylase RimI-like enzyme